MKIGFIYEGQTFQPTKEHIGRTDINWAYSLNAPMLNQYDVKNVGNSIYDILIYIVPKKNPFLTNPTLFKSKCKRLGVMQEADQNNWHDYDIQTQINYLEFINHCDFILCHNEMDRKYFAGLWKDIPVEVLPTLMLTDNLNINTLQNVQRSGVMLGGTMCKWYGGMDSLLTAHMFEEDELAEAVDIYIPAMGRKNDDEDLLPVKYLPYTNWTNWMQNLAKRKYAVHLMRTYAAGSFPLNCAALKIPCIGWKGTDTQRLLYPELSFEEGDMVAVRKAATHLKDNVQFYNHVTEYAYRTYLELYSEDKFKEHCNEFFLKIM